MYIQIDTSIKTIHKCLHIISVQVTPLVLKLDVFDKAVEKRLDTIAAGMDPIDSEEGYVKLASHSLELGVLQQADTTRRAEVIHPIVYEVYIFNGGEVTLRKNARPRHPTTE